MRGPSLPCVLFCVGFAGWTVLCHLVVALGGSLHVLLLVAAAALVATVGAGVGAWRRGWRPPRPEDPAHPLPGPLSWREAAGRGIALLACMALVAVYAYTRNVRLFWIGSCLLLLCGFAFALSRGSEAPSGDPRASDGWILLALAVAGAVLALVIHLPNSDDTLYVNMAVGAVDHPGEPLLARDTMFGIPGVPLMLPVYRAHSYELLGAAVSWLTGAPALAVFHVLFAALAGALVPLALAEVFRVLIGRDWLFGVVAALAFLALDGESGHARFGFVRLFQGKSVFLTALVPLLVAWSIRFCRAPTWRGWWLLVAAQTASLGLTATALWIAPLVTAIGLAVMWSPTLRRTRAVLAGLASAWYPVLVGLILRAETLHVLAGSPATGDPARIHLRSQFLMFGYGHHLYGCFAILLGTWCVCRGATAVRFAAVFPLVFFLLLFNPLLAGSLVEGLTGGRTFWRVYWVLPFPLLVAVAAASAMRLPWIERRGAAVRWAAGVGALLVLGTFLARAPLTSDPELRVDWPGLKVPPCYEVARRLNEIAGPESHVLAPPEVAVWVPVMHGHAYPLVPKLTQAEGLKAHVGAEEGDRRARLARFVDGAGSMPPDEFRRDLDRYDLSGVVIREGTAQADEARRVLEERGFALDGARLGFETWIRRR